MVNGGLQLGKSSINGGFSNIAGWKPWTIFVGDFAINLHSQNIFQHAMFDHTRYGVIPVTWLAGKKTELNGGS